MNQILYSSIVFVTMNILLINDTLVTQDEHHDILKFVPAKTKNKKNTKS